MEIDDDIVRAKVPEYIKDTLNLFHKELQQGETDYFGMLTRLAVIIDIKAKSDTAKQIFKELDEAVWEQIEPSRLEEFYEQFSNAKDLKASLNVATAFSIIGLDAEKYEALKKKHDIEE